MDAAATQGSRPSPTKRPIVALAHSPPNKSPGMTTTSLDRHDSSRVLRTKLSNTVLAEQAESAVIAADVSQLLPVPGPNSREPSTPPVLTGLKDAIEHELEPSLPLGAAEINDAAVAEEQQRQLYALPTELHARLARLCSQHYLSEYNTLKRVVAQQQQQQQEQAPALMRSHSSPPLGQQPSSPFSTSAANTPNEYTASSSTPVGPAPTRPAPVVRTSTGWPNIFKPVLTAVTPPPSTLQNTAFQDSALAYPRAESSSPTSLTPTIATVASRPPTSATTSVTTEQNVAAALGDALSTPMVKTVPVPVPPVMAKSSSQTLLPGMQIINGVVCKTSASHPMNISSLVPQTYLTSLADQLWPPNTTSPPKTPLTPSLCAATNTDSNEKAGTACFRLTTPALGDLWDLMVPSGQENGGVDQLDAVTELAPIRAAGRTVGNFMLSSCPGKKVRMEAVTQAQAAKVAAAGGGRSAICRDVVMDLGRAKAEGVGVVICCLDDQELAFLGAPWPEYARAAAHHSLRVIRIPMVEGFAPVSPAALDEQLDRVVRYHTLRGESVLAHCRGGIGRAGLVACCWMLKMGLISFDAGAAEESMHVVERVIDVIRRRRSVKSIETPVQVAFLLAYVTYLQTHATVISAADL